MLTDDQKASIAELVRKILQTDLPKEVRGELLEAFNCWPTPAGYDEPDFEGYEETDHFQVYEIVERELDVDHDRVWVCSICGAKHPDHFRVPDECWQFYVDPNFRFLCVPCYSQLVERTDGGAFERQYGKPATLAWSGPESGYPFPPGGHEEFAAMSDQQKDEFFKYARQSGHWNWLTESRR